MLDLFTHDNRLPEAVERLRIDARVVEVHRRAQSEVEAREGQQTSDRFFDNASAVMKSERELGPTVVVDLVPAVCRDGIEAACRVQGGRLGRGEPHEVVARALAEASTTQQLMALALLGAGSKGGEVFGRLKNGVGTDAAGWFKAVKGGRRAGMPGTWARWSRGRGRSRATWRGRDAERAAGGGARAALAIGRGDGWAVAAGVCGVGAAGARGGRGCGAAGEGAWGAGGELAGEVSLSWAGDRR